MKVNTIVVGFDGSDLAVKALDAAAELIAADGVVHVVTAYTLPSAADSAMILSQLPAEFRQNFDAMAGPEGELNRAEKTLARHGVQHVGHLVDDHAASAILDTADEVDADLIIVGSRGLGRATRFVRGSVSTRVASHATTSFMVIHD